MLVEVITGHAHVSLQVGDLAVALPLACYMLGLWFVRDSLVLKGPARWVLPVFAGLTAALPFAFPALEVIAALAVAAVALRAALRRRVV